MLMVRCLQTLLGRALCNVCCAVTQWRLWALEVPPVVLSSTLERV